MPYQKDGKRDYKKENRLYSSRPEQKKRRAARNQARRLMKKKKGARLGGLDIDHKDKNPLNNSSSNLRVQTKATNRSFKRNKVGGHKN